MAEILFIAHSIRNLDWHKLYPLPALVPFLLLDPTLDLLESGNLLEKNPHWRVADPVYFKCHWLSLDCIHHSNIRPFTLGRRAFGAFVVLLIGSFVLPYCWLHLALLNEKI